MSGAWRIRRHLAAAVLAGLLGASARAGDGTVATSPEPQGLAVRRIFAAQAELGAQDKYVFYDLEWMKGGNMLGPAGRDHLARVARTVGATKFPVIIEATGDPGLNNARLGALIGTLKSAGVPDAENRVVIGRPPAEGLYGEESIPLYPLLITSRFRNFGRGGYGGGFGGYGGLGGFGLGGFGGGLGGFGGGLGGFGGIGGLGYGLGGLIGGYGYGGGGYSTTSQGYRGLGY